MDARPTRICHVTSVHQPDDIRIFSKECRSLAKAGYEVFLVVVNGPTDEKDGVHRVGVPVEFGNRLARISQAPKAAYQKALELDAAIYHFHDPEFLPYANKLLTKGKKVIYDVHEDVPKQILSKFWIPKPLRKLVSQVFRVYENNVARKMTAIVTATPFIRDRFRVLHERSLDINNFPHLNELSPAEEAGAKEDEITYVGGLVEIRGIRELVDSLAHVDPHKVQLNLAGKWHPPAFLEQTKASPGWDRVNDLGFVSREEMAKVLARSVAGIVTFWPAPNHVDAQPNKMFEYMSAEVPVIGSHFPLWREIIEENECGLCVDPQDPKAIAAAIVQLLGNPELVKKMGRNGRKAVEEKYNWGVEESKLIDLYKQVEN